MPYDRAKLASDLERDEGFRGTPYRDPAGNWTVGIGWNLSARPLTEEQARALCGMQTDDIAAQVGAIIKWFGGLDDVRSRAILNMAFNIGVRGLFEFIGMLSAMKDQRWNAAADAALDSEWAKQVPNRAARIAHMIRTGSDP